MHMQAHKVLHTWAHGQPHLVHKACVAAHDHSPACVAGSHAGDVEALLPFLVDPLEREAVTDLQQEQTNNAISTHSQTYPNLVPDKNAAKETFIKYGTTQLLLLLAAAGVFLLLSSTITSMRER
jgi:hypothetical protein